MIGFGLWFEDDGTIRLRLEPWEIEVLRALPDQLRQRLETDDPSLARLRQRAYLEDAGKDEEYQRLMGDELLESRKASLAVLEETMTSEVLDAGQLEAWLRAINDLRLVLGTELDVSEDEDLDVPDDQGPEFTYAYLTYLQYELVAALSSAL